MCAECMHAHTHTLTHAYPHTYTPSGHSFIYFMYPEFGVAIECAIIHEEYKIYRTTVVVKYRDLI